MKWILAFLQMLALFVLGCSASVDNPASADSQSLIPGPRETMNSGRYILGAWNVSYDIADLSARAVPLHVGQVHYQIVNMLMPPACSNCLVVDVYGFNLETRTLSVFLTLRNPSTLDAYDVRCIVHTDDFGHEVLNADGWTGLWDKPGGGSINPFIAYAKDSPTRKFESHGTFNELINIKVPDPPEYNEITYVIDASWPDNCVEPYMIENFTQEQVIDITGASGIVRLDVFDWQDDVTDVALTLPEVIGPDSLHLTYVAGSTWEGTLVNATSAPAGHYRALVTASSAGATSAKLYDYVTLAIVESPIDLDALFAPPTEQELEEVRLNWESRDLGVHDYAIVGIDVKEDGSRMYLVSQRIHGELHYGLVMIPPGTHAPHSLPILLLTHGGVWGTGDTSLHRSGYVLENFIQVAPSFRGEQVVIYEGPLEGIYQSEGVSDVYDGDADDTISMLNLVLEELPSADGSRIAVSGGSRGGGTALRTKVRDDRVTAAIDFFGATNYFVPQLRQAAEHHLIDKTYLGDDALEQGIIGKVIIPLLQGYSTITGARRKMIRGSPVFFAENLPRVQVHHGALDPVVPVHQSDSLDDMMTLLGITAPDYVYYRYPNGEHTKESLPGASDRALELLMWVVDGD